MAKRGRPKKKTFNELLREKMAKLADEAIERQRPKAPEEIGKYDGYKTSENTRKQNRKAVRKYYATPKGKETNRRCCKTYYHNHPERVKGYVARYKEKFEEKYGCKLNSWLYWSTRLNSGKARPEDVPKRFAKILKEWEKKNGFVSQGV